MRTSQSRAPALILLAPFCGLLILAACAEKPVAVTPAPIRVVTMKPIPNPEPRPEPVHAAVAPPVVKPPKAATAKAKPEAAPAHPAHETPATPAAEAANPAEAAKLREAGLVELNRGAIGRAVALLERANRLDPANSAIKHDLERAQRISKALGAGR